jgi:hypothetical protein
LKRCIFRISKIHLKKTTYYDDEIDLIALLKIIWNEKIVDKFLYEIMDYEELMLI